MPSNSSTDLAISYLNKLIVMSLLGFAAAGSLAVFFSSSKATTYCEWPAFAALCASSSGLLARSCGGVLASSARKQASMSIS